MAGELNLSVDALTFGMSAGGIAGLARHGRGRRRFSIMCIMLFLGVARMKAADVYVHQTKPLMLSSIERR